MSKDGEGDGSVVDMVLVADELTLTWTAGSGGSLRLHLRVSSQRPG